MPRVPLGDKNPLIREAYSIYKDKDVCVHNYLIDLIDHIEISATCDCPCFRYAIVREAILSKPEMYFKTDNARAIIKNLPARVERFRHHGYTACGLVHREREANSAQGLLVMKKTRSADGQYIDLLAVVRDVCKPTKCLAMMRILDAFNKK